MTRGRPADDQPMTRPGVRPCSLIRFHGVLAPNAKLRALVAPQWSAQPQEASEAVVATACEAEPIQFRSGRISWARLLKRVLAAT